MSQVISDHAVKLAKNIFSIIFLIWHELLCKCGSSDCDLITPCRENEGLHGRDLPVTTIIYGLREC